MLRDCSTGCSLDFRQAVDVCKISKDFKRRKSLNWRFEMWMKDVNK